MRAGGRSAFCALLLLAGCRSTEPLENELRARDSQYRGVLEALRQLESRNDALQREVAALRSGQHLPPEQAAPSYSLNRIVLGRGTGGYDNDGLPGDEALQVIVQPTDGDGHTIKVPGTMCVSVLEILPNGLKRPLCWWTFGPEQLNKSWKQGLMSTGYTLVLPWTAFPATENVRVTVLFKLLDGRAFEADRDAKVRVVPGAPRLAEPAPAPLPLDAKPSLPQPTPPAPMPPPETGPSLTPATPLPVLPTPSVLPTGRVTAAYTPLPAESVRWSPVPLSAEVSISRPEPLQRTSAPLPVP